MEGMKPRKNLRDTGNRAETIREKGVGRLGRVRWTHGDGRGLGAVNTPHSVRVMSYRIGPLAPT